MYLVICYDVKNQTVDTIDKFETFEKAQKYIETDVCNVYQQEKFCYSLSEKDFEMEIREDSAILKEIPEEKIWTWEIREI